MLFLFLLFGHATWHVGSQFPDQEAESFNHWTTTEVLRKAILLEDGFKFYFVLVYSFFFFVVNSVIHWNKTAMGLHVFPIPILVYS